MTQQEFSQFLEMSPASLSSIFTGRTNPTLNIVESIKKKFENINLNWLMFGNGPMFETPENGNGDDPDNLSDDSVAPNSQDINSVNAGSGLQYRNNCMPDGTNVTGSRQMSGNFAGMQNNVGISEMKYFNNNRRKIKEIRVFYDDQTYESFVPKE